MHKGIQWGEGCSALWLYHFHTSQCSYATASSEEELEEEKDEVQKCHRRFLHAGTFLHERTSIMVHSRPLFSQPQVEWAQ